MDYVYKSWFALQKRRKYQIEGKERWLKMLKSDLELEQESQCSLNVIRTKATEILTKFTPQSEQNSNQKKGKKTKKSTKSKKSSLFQILLNTYRKTEDPLTRCALAYLLKNKCKISELDEDPEEFTRNRRKKEIGIERLKDQLQSRIPKGRDLTGEEWLETLDRINNPFPRPSKPNYQGQPSILVGVSFGLKKPVTVAVVDVVKNEVLAYRSVKQLLGENYNLLNRQRQQQQRLSHERHKAQKQNAPNSFGESELGQYIDKIISRCNYCDRQNISSRQHSYPKTPRYA